ncbi:MAG: radical SAM protein [Firmicutes bacterium]|nr:radical SAM protein [Bacillota bacterium]
MNGKTLWAAAPSAKFYDSGVGYRNLPATFPAVSITGQRCALDCAHCGKQLLRGMIDVSRPGSLSGLIPKLRAAGAYGVLVSGGADSNGRVPLAQKYAELRQLKEAGFSVVVHTGLVSREEARELKALGIDQVLFDLIGDDATIRDVYRLRATAADYRRTLEELCAAGLTVVPHIVVGLNYGRIFSGETQAIEWAAESPVPGLVIVILSPLKGTRMAMVSPPEPAAVAEVLVLARERFAERRLMLGCARPANAEKEELERIAVDIGVDGIAYASAQTITYAEAMGYTVKFFAGCCSLLVGQT